MGQGGSTHRCVLVNIHRAEFWIREPRRTSQNNDTIYITFIYKRLDVAFVTPVIWDFINFKHVFQDFIMVYTTRLTRSKHADNAFAGPYIQECKEFKGTGPINFSICLYGLGPIFLYIRFYFLRIPNSVQPSSIAWASELQKREN